MWFSNVMIILNLEQQQKSIQEWNNLVIHFQGQFQQQQPKKNEKKLNQNWNHKFIFHRAKREREMRPLFPFFFCFQCDDREQVKMRIIFQKHETCITITEKQKTRKTLKCDNVAVLFHKSWWFFFFFFFFSTKKKKIKNIT